ncbi:uncharacterized protein LOC120343430 isoform X2 [Styela clava]
MGDVGIGIDFGTSFSCVAVCRDGKVEVIANEHDKRLTPSYVAFTEEERLYGDAARHQNPLNLKNTFYQTKMLLGRKYEEIPKGAFIGYDIEASDSKLKLPFIYKGKNKPLSPEQVSAMVIGKMKKDAEIYLDTEVKRAVISVPTSFNHAQRKATIDAGKIAGFETVELINGTTAAAIAYGLDREKDQERNVLILDFGGGKFDVSIVKIHKRNFQVMGAYGDSCFGGEDFDNNLVRHFTGDESNFNDKKAICRLQEACEKAKRTLSGASRARIRVDCLFGGKPFSSEITRSDFEDINKEFFDRAMEIVKKVFRCANVKRSEITELVPVGGSTRIPKFRHLIQEYFNGMELSRTINPDEAVACGAAFHCASKRINGYTMVDVAPRPIVIKSDRNTQEYTLVKPQTNLPSFIELTAQPGSQWQVFENEPLVGSTKDSIFTVQADSMTVTEFCWKIDVNGLVKIETSVKGDKIKPIIISGNKRNVTEDKIQQMMKQHKMFQEDDDMIAQASDARNVLEKYAYSVKQSVMNPKYKDELEDHVKDEITAECNKILEWLDDNQSATAEQSKTKRTALEKICGPLLKIKAMNLEQQKIKAEERKLREKAKNDLQSFIHNAESNAKLQRFEKFIKEKSAILQNCCILGNWMKDNQDATKTDIYENLEKFRNYIASIFEKMEQYSSAETHKEPQLISESKQKLEECLDNVKTALSNTEYAEFLTDHERKKINEYYADAYALIENPSNPTPEDLNERITSLELNCYPIFRGIDNKVAIKSLVTLLKELEADLKYERSNDAELVEMQNACGRVREWINNSKALDTEELVKKRKNLKKRRGTLFGRLNQEKQVLKKRLQDYLDEMDENIRNERSDDPDLQKLQKTFTSVQERIKTCHAFGELLQMQDTLTEYRKLVFDRLSGEKEEASKNLTSSTHILKNLLEQASELIENEIDDYKQQYEEIMKWMESNPNVKKSEYELKKESIDNISQKLLQRLEQVQTKEMKREEVELQQDLVSLEHFSKKVFNVTAELAKTNKINSNKEKSIMKTSKEILKLVRNGEIKTRSDCKKFHDNLHEIYKSLHEIEKQKNKEDEKDLVIFVEYVKTLATSDQDSDDSNAFVLNKCDEISKWISNNKEAIKNDYDSKKEELRSVAQPIFDQLDQQKELLKAEQRKARRSLINYVTEAKNYLLSPANRQRLSLVTQNGLINSCNTVLSWTSTNKAPDPSDCEKKKQDFNHICMNSVNNMKQEDKTFAEELNNLARRVDKDISNLKNKDENYLKLQNDVDKITEWISANKTAVKSEYESKIQQLDKIQQYVTDKLSEQQKIENRMRKEEKEQQQSARQAFKNDVLEVHNYLDSITEERLSSRVKTVHLDQCKEHLTWMRDHQTSQSAELERRQNCFKKNIVPIIDNLKQEDMNALHKLHELLKDVKSAIDRTGNDELKDKEKLQCECTDITDWIFKNPKVHMTDYENKQNELDKIKKDYQQQLEQKNQELQSDFMSYLKQIKRYLEKIPYVELIHKDEKQTLLSQHSIGHLWIEEHKNVKNCVIIKKKQLLSDACQPIFDRLLQAEFNRTKKSFEDEVHSVEKKIHFEYSSLKENDRRFIKEKCKHARQMRDKYEGSNTEALKKLHRDFTSAVMPILTRLELEGKTAITQTPGRSNFIPEPALAVEGKSVFDSQGPCKQNYKTQAQSQKALVIDDRFLYVSDSQLQEVYYTQHETTRPKSARPSSSNSRSNRNKETGKAINDLISYAEGIKKELNEDARREKFLIPSERQEIYGACSNAINNIKALKEPTLGEIERRRKQLEMKYQTCGLSNCRRTQSDWV